MKATQLKKVYFDWLMEAYDYQNIEKNVIRIKTPFLDTDFDDIIMYAVIQQDGQIIVTDDGWTLNNLKGKGLNITKRNTHVKRLLDDITVNLGIHLTDNELSITTDLEKFPIAKQRLLQAIMQVNDLEVLINNRIKNTLFEEIESYLNSREILYTSRPSFAGKGGITVQFDFSIPTHKRGEKLIRTISNGNDLNRAKLLTMDTQLLKNYKKTDSYIAIIDDTLHEFTKQNEVQAIFKENSSDKIITLTKSHLYSQPNSALLAN
ncbi:DUF1828 domain-containing protein [Streptococcus suis]|uniref:DUF1828 domain-containing protein n=1 Tax=Streptococcus suis TaxID=1307 RepID=UPI00300FCB4D